MWSKLVYEMWTRLVCRNVTKISLLKCVKYASAWETNIVGVLGVAQIFCLVMNIKKVLSMSLPTCHTLAIRGPSMRPLISWSGFIGCCGMLKHPPRAQCPKSSYEPKKEFKEAYRAAVLPFICPSSAPSPNIVDLWVPFRSTARPVTEYLWFPQNCNVEE